jgi:hypothetical protein
MRPDALNAIDAVEPYGGGKGDLFWQLQSLSNFDKHRLLVPVWGGLRAHTSLPSQRAKLMQLWHESHPGERNPPDLTGVFYPARKFPLRQGEVLLAVSGDDIENNMTFMLDVSFGEPTIVEGKPVVDTLQEMSMVILRLIGTFDEQGLLV